jgi:eukaryotic-like serine/threonine-protein kinase
MGASKLPTARLSEGDRERRISPSAAAPLALGRYRLGRRLGSGAFGTVWVAHDERLDREVAVKVVPRERIVGGRFEREARAAARLAHPGIVTLYEAAIDDDGAYLVSELVRGVTLDALLEAGRLSDRDIVAIAIALCDALSHAHAQGVVHRDVKPSNVLIPARPTSVAHPAKLTDFGVARVIGGDSLTRTGDVVGTAAYMAPEQAEGRVAGPSADLYALALVTYEALTGVNPVRIGTAAVRARRLGAHLPPLRRQRRDLPRELGRGIDLALRPRPRERGTLEEFRGALSSSLPQAQETPGVVGTHWPRSPRSESQRPDGHELPEQAPAVQPSGPAEEPASPAASGRREPVSPAAPGWPARALAGAAAAASTAWLASHMLAPAPVAPAAAALLAGVLVLALPRIGWLALTAGLIGAATGQHRPGGALVVLIAALVPVVLLPGTGVAWPVSVAAPALGMVGLAGAWPALAAKAGNNVWRRAVLGLTGWIWLVAAALLAGAGLYTQRPPGTPPADVWTASLGVTLHHVLAPVLSSGALAGAPVWALAAVVLPWLVRGRSLAVDAVRVTIWAVTVPAATEAAIAMFHGAHGLSAPPTAAAGAVAGAFVALSPTVVNGWRSRRHSGSPCTEVP